MNLGLVVYMRQLDVLEIEPTMQSEHYIPKVNAHKGDTRKKYFLLFHLTQKSRSHRSLPMGPRGTQWWGNGMYVAISL